MSVTLVIRAIKHRSQSLQVLTQSAVDFYPVLYEVYKMARRFEFQDDGSSKFWEVELNGVSVTTSWGRIGTNGQSKSKDFDSEAKAKKEYDKLIAEKISKGYVEVASQTNSGISAKVEDSVPNKTSSSESSTLEDIFFCMKLWLKEHDGAIVHSFAKTEPTEELAELKEQVGKKLPDDLVTLFKTFNRIDDDVQEKEITTRLFGGFFLMPLRGVDGVLMEHESFEDMEYTGGAAEGPVKRMYYNALWVPFAKDFGGNFIGVDLDPAKGGDRGQVIRFGRDEVPTVLAPDLVHFFVETCLDVGVDLPSSLHEFVGDVHKKAKVISLYSDDESADEEADEEQVRKPVSEKQKSSFAKISGVAKSILREPSMICSGLEFLLQSLESEKDSVRASAMEEINELACEKLYFDDMLEPEECGEIHALLQRSAEKIQSLLVNATTKTEAEEAMKALAELKYEQALPDIVKWLENPKTRLEAVWCIGKFGEASTAAASELINIVDVYHKQMGTQGEIFDTVEAALIGLEEMNYVPRDNDEIFGALVVSRDASIAALCCRLLSRNAALARKYTDYIKPLVHDRRGRLSESAQQALSAAR